MGGVEERAVGDIEDMAGDGRQRSHSLSGQHPGASLD